MTDATEAEKGQWEKALRSTTERKTKNDPFTLIFLMI